MNEPTPPPLPSGGEFLLPPPTAPFKAKDKIQVGAFILTIESIGSKRGVFSFQPKLGEDGEPRRVVVPALTEETSNAVEAMNRSAASVEGAVALLKLISTFCKSGMDPREAVNTASRLIQ